MSIFSFRFEINGVLFFASLLFSTQVNIKWVIKHIYIAPPYATPINVFVQLLFPKIAKVNLIYILFWAA